MAWRKPIPPDVMFNEASYQAVFQPIDSVKSLPPWCYTTEEFFAAEVEHIFMKTWNFFGNESRIPSPGDYFCEMFLDIPLIVARGKDGKIRAFSNSCRHRGARLIEGEGNTKVFRCPYHWWVYDLDGKLRSAVGMRDVVNFDHAKNGLVEFPVETWDGFIFVRFVQDGPSLADHLGDLPEQMAAYDCGNLVETKRIDFLVKCNWKNHIENSVEDYHVPMVHSGTLNKLEGGYEHFNPPTTGNWLNMRERHAGTRALLREDAHHALPRIPGIHGHAAEGTNFVCLFPCTLLALTVDSVWYVRLAPYGPHSTRVTLGTLFPRASVERPDFAEKAAYYYKRWVVAVAEDNEITETQLEGLKSPFASSGRLSRDEPVVPQMGAWWARVVLNGVNEKSVADKVQAAG